MSRSLKKGPFCDEHLMKKVEAQKDGKKSVIKEWIFIGSFILTRVDK